MKKIIALDFDEFLVPGNTKEEFSGMIFENAVNDWDAIRMGKLTYNSILTKYYLRNFNKYVSAGNMPDAEKSIRDAYNQYDSIIKGVPKSLLYDFSEEYAKEFSKDGKEVLKELKNEDWEIYIVSGAIKPCVDIILEKNGVKEFFKGIYCNTLEAENGIIKGLKKEIITPDDKIIRLKKEYPSLNMSEDLTAVGHDVFDSDILKAANLAIILDTVKKRSDDCIKQTAYERRKNRKKTRIINNLYELPDALEQMRSLDCIKSD